MDQLLNTTSTAVIVAFTTVVTIGLASLCRKRKREDSIDIDSESKRPKLDEAASSSNLSESSPTPGSPLGEANPAEALPEAPLGEELSKVASPAPVSTDLVDAFEPLPVLIDNLGNPNPATIVYDPVCSLYEYIDFAIEKILEREHMLIPNHLSSSDLARFALYDEETDLEYLTDIVSELFMYGTNSGYFELVLDCLQNCCNLFY
jgi:hypothetical protein